MIQSSCLNTPPQAGEWRSVIPSLGSEYWSEAFVAGLVSISASWWMVPIFRNSIVPLETLSLVMWQSISICFVLSWKTELLAMWMAA